MGDIKLAGALGALLGPVPGAIAMLLSMMVGGVVAMVWMLKEWGMFGRGWVSTLVGWLYPSLRNRDETVEKKDVSGVTIPYGVALAIGTLLTLVVCQWTGKENWFF